MQEATVHEIELPATQFEPIHRGKKHVLHVRQVAHPYQLHDVLLLREYDSDAGERTGRHRLARVTHIDKGGPESGKLLANGVVALSLLTFREPRGI